MLVGQMPAYHLARPRLDLVADTEPLLHLPLRLHGRGEDSAGLAQRYTRYGLVSAAKNESSDRLGVLGVSCAGGRANPFVGASGDRE